MRELKPVLQVRNVYFGALRPRSCRDGQLKIYSLVGNIKMFMQHFRNGLIMDLINS